MEETVSSKMLPTSCNITWSQIQEDRDFFYLHGNFEHHIIFLFIRPCNKLFLDVKVEKTTEQASSVSRAFSTAFL
jgi:hypothetical protein